MSHAVEAIYENGVLRLTQPIDLAEGTAVEVIVVPRVIPGKPTPAEICAEIAAMKEESCAENVTGRAHDTVLYGGSGAR
jgi:predicted DNA-binding antitoxin AbrB/MazE fold protein